MNARPGGRANGDLLKLRRVGAVRNRMARGRTPPGEPAPRGRLDAGGVPE